MLIKCEYSGVELRVQWKLNLADIDLAEKLDLKDTPQKIWATIFDFYYINPLKIAENFILADNSSVTDFSAKSSFHCISFKTRAVFLAPYSLKL